MTDTAGGKVATGDQRLWTAARIAFFTFGGNVGAAGVAVTAIERDRLWLFVSALLLLFAATGLGVVLGESVCHGARKQLRKSPAVWHTVAT